MKNLRHLLVAAASLAGAAASAAPSTASSGSFGREWMAHYYQHPQPGELITAVRDLEDQGAFEAPGDRATALGFFATVFRDNPRRVDFWLRTSRRVLSDRSQRLLAAAAWMAGAPHAGDAVLALGSSDPSSVRSAVEATVGRNPPAPVEALAIDSQPALDAQWGGFLATGDARYIRNVFTALGSGQAGLANTARFELAQSAVSDPRVMEICQQELQRQPQSVRASFEAALNQAGARPPGA